MSKKGKYKKEAREAAKTLLQDRNLNTDLKDLYFKKYNEYYDDDLVKLLATNKKELYKDEADAIVEILKQRGYEFKEPAKKNDKKKSRRKYARVKKNDYIPLILGILIFLFWFIFSTSYDNTRFYYENAKIISIIVSSISSLFVTSYAIKQDRKYIFLWAIGGFIFSPISLLVIGILEVFYDYKK